MTTALFSGTDALRFGWNATRAHLKPLLILGAVAAFLALLGGSLDRAPLLRAVVQVAQIAVSLIYVRAALRLHDGKPIDLGAWQSMLSGFWGYLLTNVLLVVIVTVGLVLLIVPGLVWAATYGFATFLVADRDLDPIAALRESRRLTAGARWQLVGFGLLMLLTNLLGALAFGVGLLVTVPTTYVAAVFVLRRLQARVGEPVAALRESHA